MKRTFFCLVLLLACVLLWSGCSDPQPDRASPPDNSSAEPPASKRDNLPFTGEQLYAAAYLGYQEINDLDAYAEQYLDSGLIPTHYLSPGDFYLIIPRYSGMALSLYQNDFDTLEPVLRFEDPDCTPFIVQCNVSDIFPDAVIRLSYEGKTVEFSPFISLMDGSVEVGPDGLDITLETTS